MRKVKVRATVVYPVYIDEEIEVADEATADDIEEAVLDLADKYFDSSSIDPVIQDMEPTE